MKRFKYIIGKDTKFGDILHLIFPFEEDLRFLFTTKLLKQMDKNGGIWWILDDLEFSNIQPLMKDSCTEMYSTTGTISEIKHIIETHDYSRLIELLG